LQEKQEKESSASSPELPSSEKTGPTAAQKQEAEYQHLEKQFRAKLATPAASPEMLARTSSRRNLLGKGVS
jgi:hypothetical protein